MVKDPVWDLCLARDDDPETLALLREWFKWWVVTDEAPAKMPNSLHTRTVAHLVVREEQAT